MIAGRQSRQSRGKRQQGRRQVWGELNFSFSFVPLLMEIKVKHNLGLKYQPTPFLITKNMKWVYDSQLNKQYEKALRENKVSFLFGIQLFPTWNNVTLKIMPPVPSTDNPLQTGTMVINSSLPSSKDLSPVRMTVAGGGGVGKSALGTK